jgi:hypothetical protein
LKETKRLAKLTALFQRVGLIVERAELVTRHGGSMAPRCTGASLDFV